MSTGVTENRLTLGQIVVPDGICAIGVILDLLDTLDLVGAIVTIDAAGCQRENAAVIHQRQGHFLLAVKGNQPGLQDALQAVFDGLSITWCVKVAQTVSRM